jgi:hypothetical protein
MPSRRAVLMIRQAISPRLAIRMRLNIRPGTVVAAARSRRVGVLSTSGRE